MSARLLETPLRGRLASDLIMLYGDFPAALRPETPLAYEARPATEVRQHVLVQLDVIFEYQRIIFDLERTVLVYKAALERLIVAPEPIEEGPSEPSTPVNAVSVRVINSILAAHIQESAVLRAPDEED